MQWEDALDIARAFRYTFKDDVPHEPYKLPGLIAIMTHTGDANTLNKELIQASQTFKEGPRLLGQQPTDNFNIDYVQLKRMIL